MQAPSSNFSLYTFLCGLLVGFLPGFFSGYLLDRIRDRRGARKEQSKSIFEPLHVQLSKARNEVAVCERAHSIDRNFWNQLNETGRLNEIPSSVQLLLRELFSDIIPNYEAAWRAVNENGVQEVLEPWAKKVGMDHTRGEIPRFPKWYRFLSADEFRPSLLELQSPGIVPLWNAVTNEQRLAESGTTVDQFLGQLWNEARTQPVFQSLCKTRQAALRNLSQLIPEIHKRIRR